MIELDSVTKRYGRRRTRPAALSDVSLHVPAGAVWAVVGPNGAGKSTLLALVLGFIRPSAGAVRVGGSRPRDYLRDEGAAYLPERFDMPAAWRVRDALHMLARLDGDDGRAAAGAADRLGLGPHLDKRAGELSRGLLQRVGLAQTLLARRALVVLDEPTEGLDPLWRIRLRDIIGELRADGRTVLLASHDLAEVERVADRAVLLDGGRVREVLDTTGAGDDDALYRVRLAAPFATATDAFPDAAFAADGLAFTATVSGPAELSARLGALIALGAVVAGVEPARQPLEQRVRDALGGDA
jgi:ABC-2 type transport system ATP-binding protein